MTAMSLLVQSALLVLVAYFVGAWIGCVLRRLAARGRTEAVATTPAPTGTAPPEAQTAERFNKALAGQGASVEPVPAPPSKPAPVFEPVAPTIETIPERPAPPPPAPKKDDFALIRGVDEVAQDVLAAAGVRTFAALGALKADDVRRLDETLGSRGRIARENWIEQAQMLAAEKLTAHALQRDAGAGIQLAAPTPDEGTPLTVDVGTSAEDVEAAPPSGKAVDVDAAQLAGAELPPEPVPVAPASVEPASVVPAAAPPVPATPQPTGETSSISPDEDLQNISGITPEINQLLNARGVRRYAQIAGWSSTDIARIERLLGVPGRIANENWVAQARALAGEDEPATSMPPAPAVEPDDLLSAVEPAATTNLAGLRSVKSPAFTGGQAAAPARAGQPADLKRIRGIGVMIEKKLHMLGIHSYEQIANWTRSDIDRVSHELDFKGRIERENWVEQARILVAGGQTNFSRRFDTRSPPTKPDHTPGMNGSDS